MSERWDVVVVGGGPAGSASATLFAQQGRRVVLVDAARFPRAKACAEYVSPGGAAILDRLGVLQDLDRTGQRRWLRGMQIRAPGGECHLLEYVDANGGQRYGLSVSRLVLDNLLLETAAARGVEVRQGFRVRSVSRTTAGRVTGVVGRGDECLSADLVVGADGLNSVVARTVGETRRPIWPRRLGLVAHFEGVAWPEDHGQMLVNRHGYVGAAPLDGHGRITVGLVRSMPHHRLGSPLPALQAGLADYPELAKRVSGGRLSGPVLGVGPLARRVRRLSGPGFALVGDAAGFFDPFSGEGIFRALRGAELLAANPDAYPERRRAVFGAKERLVALIQVVVRTPSLMDFAVARLKARPTVASELGSVLGDLRPARLALAWRLFGP